MFILPNIASFVIAQNKYPLSHLEIKPPSVFHLDSSRKIAIEQSLRLFVLMKLDQPINTQIDCMTFRRSGRDGELLLLLLREHAMLIREMEAWVVGL